MKLKITHEKNNWKESPAILSRHKKKVSKIKDAAVKITHHKGQKEKKNEKKQNPREPWGAIKHTNTCVHCEHRHYEKYSFL